MNPTQHALVEALVAAVRAEAACRAAVDTARGDLHNATTRAAELVQQLMREGMPSTEVAFHAARALGLPANVAARTRAAARLRQQVSRLVTRRHRFRAAPLGEAESSHLTSNGKEADMAIVHRKITEEWIEDPEVESLDEGDCDDEECDDEDVVAEKPRTRRS